MQAEIDFANIYPRGGSKRAAFEELSFLLFAREFEGEGRIVRREGIGGDRGLEAYVADEEGKPIRGLQAKLFPGKIGSSQWRQIKESGTAAILGNRAFGSLRAVVFSVSRNLNEAGEKRWKALCAEWNTLAHKEGFQHKIDFQFLSESGMRNRLLVESNRGLLLHYFGFPDFDESRCADATRSNVDNLQDRYLPGLHVQTEAEDAIHTFLRSERFRQRFLEAGKDPLGRIFAHPDPSEWWSDALRTLHGDLVNTASEVLPLIGDGVDLPGNLTTLLRAIARTEEKLGPLMEQLRTELPRTERRSRDEWSLPREPSREEQCYEAFAGMRSTMSSFKDFLEENLSYDTRCLLMTGNPGEGKTHVLAEVCSRYCGEGGVALFFEGRIFNAAKSPQETVLAGADFPSTSFRDFLATFESLRAANGQPNLICIDALNETTDRDFWKKHLIPFADEICRFSGIRLIVSCRSDFAEKTLPEEISKGNRTGWSAVVHSGLGLRVVEALPKYFRAYDLKGTQIPPLAREFETPLFLKIFCEAFAGRTPDIGRHTLPTIVEAYSERKAAQIAEKIDCDPDQVLSLLAGLAKAIYNGGGGPLSVSDARNMCEASFQAGESSKSLLRALLSESVLCEVPIGVTGPLGGTSMGIRFTYERIWDYFYSLQLLGFESSPADELRRLVRDATWRWENPGLLGMLAIRLPHECGVELLEMLPADQHDHVVQGIWMESLDWRSQDSWSTVTSDLFEALTEGDDDRRFELLMKFALNPGHPRNVLFLHRELSVLSLAERDRTWTAWITRVLTDYRTPSGVEELLAWAGEGDLGSIPDDSILLIGLSLAWMASTTSRKSRTEIIDKLLRVLSWHPEAATRLLEMVIGVDDPYVVEAVLIGCLGCCQQQSIGKSYAARIARIAYEKFFEPEQQPTHILLRYYAAEICNRACSIGASGDEIDPARIVPPWNSKQLRIWSEKTLKQRVAAFSGRGRAESRISTVLHSVEPNSPGSMYGAFGRYVMEGDVDQFLETRLDKEPPRKIEFKHRFNRQRAKRFIVQRLFEMGWDPEALDLPSEDRSHLHDTEKTERLSKKYQWIALHELIGGLSDHHHYTGWGDEVKRAPSVRKLCRYYIRDPFVPDSLWSREMRTWPFAKAYTPWWLGNLNPLPVPLRLAAKRSFIAEVTTHDPMALLEFDRDGTKWIVLNSYSRWWEPCPIWVNKHQHPKASISWAFRSYLVAQGKEGASINLFSRKDIGNGRLWPDEPEFGQPAHFLQSYPDGQIDLRERCFLDKEQFAEAWNTGAVSTTCHFSPETDAGSSLKGSIPSPWLAEIGGLRWSGDGLNFVTQGSETPAVQNFGEFPKTVCLADKKVLRKVLKENNLQIVWRCFGEKLLSNDREIPGGRAYWMAFSMDGSGSIVQHSAQTIAYPLGYDRAESVMWLPKG